MIKRPTIVLLILFIIALGLVFLLPALQGKDDDSVASATPRPKLLSTGLIFTQIKLVGSGVETALLHQQKDGNWIIDHPAGASVTPGQVEQIFSELNAIEIVSPLPTPPPLSAISLDAPKWILQLSASEEKAVEIRIGALAPTGGGYYVSLDGQSPVVINRYGIDRVIEILTGLAPAQPATEATPEG